jgi:hypothetical protein
MKRWWTALLVLAGLAVSGWGYACCNEVHTGGDGQQWISCRHQVDLKEAITVRIPLRLALHLTESRWDLDLAHPPRGDVSAKEGCFLVPKGFQGGPKDLLALLEAGQLTPADTYPAIVDADGNGQISDDEKGTLVCFNKKVLQKFCNNWEEGTGYGCEFDLKVNVVRPFPFTGNYGRMFFHDDVTLPPVGEVYVREFVEIVPGQNDNGEPIEMVKVKGARFPGWLDDFITEGFWFDGSEVPLLDENGRVLPYEFNVIFMLTAI